MIGMGLRPYCHGYTLPMNRDGTTIVIWDTQDEVDQHKNFVIESRRFLVKFKTTNVEPFIQEVTKPGYEGKLTAQKYRVCYIIDKILYLNTKTLDYMDLTNNHRLGGNMTQTPYDRPVKPVRLKKSESNMFT